jgi:hypothetical protein
MRWTVCDKTNEKGEANPTIRRNYFFFEGCFFSSFFGLLSFAIALTSLTQYGGLHVF